MKLIVGLGNPGRQYKKTRHNIGFEIVDELANKKEQKIANRKFNGLYTTFHVDSIKVMLLKPQLYMNNSGEVIKKFIEYFGINIEDILVIYDDCSIEVGKYKIKKNGSSAGHNGLKSIAKHLQTDNFKRIKIGISKDPQMLLPDYVLGKFNNEQTDKLEPLKNHIVGIIDDYLKYDFEKFLSLHNNDLNKTIDKK